MGIARFAFYKNFDYAINHTKILFLKALTQQHLIQVVYIISSYEKYFFTFIPFTWSLL